MKYPCLVVDHDDTVVDSTATVHFPCFVEYMAKYHPHIHYSLEQYLADNFDPGIVALFRDIVGMNDEEIAHEERYWNSYVQNHVPKAYEGMRELLWEQKERGGRQCVVTHSYAHNILRDYRENGLPEPDMVFGWGSPANERKPSPYPLMKIMDEYGLEPTQLLMLDDKAYISDEEFAETLAGFDGRTEASVLAGYDAVLHLVTCAKGAEFAYNLGNEARTESIEYAREMDDRTLRAWSGHPNLKIIDNYINFEDKINRAMREIYRIVGQPEPMAKKRKYLIAVPDMKTLAEKYRAVPIDMVQTYLCMTNPCIERRVRRQKYGAEYLYFYTEKHIRPDGTKWDTERPITEKEYNRYLLEADPELQSVDKTKSRFVYDSCRFEIDIYPFSAERAIMFRYSENDEAAIPPEILVIREVTGDPSYKNRQLAKAQKL